MTATMPETGRDYWQGEPVPPVYPPNMVSGWGEGEQATRAVVQVQMCLSRDELLWALNERCATGDSFDVSAWSVEKIRAEVETYAAGVGDFQLSQEAAHLWVGYNDWTEQERANVAALLRAIDRAYPATYQSGIVVDGGPQNPRVRCIRCGWSQAGGEVEPLMHSGLVHSGLHGEGR